jgi:creatine kinase
MTLVDVADDEIASSSYSTTSVKTTMAAGPIRRSSGAVVLRALTASIGASYVSCEKAKETSETNQEATEKKRSVESNRPIYQFDLSQKAAASSRSFLLATQSRLAIDTEQSENSVVSAASDLSSGKDAIDDASGDDYGDGAVHLDATKASDSYPNFSRHGANALLPKYLTKELFVELMKHQTANGVRLEDIIRAGVCLPYGANPPRGIAGIFAGDAESYRTFSKLFMPLIEEFHHTPRRHKKKTTKHEVKKEQAKSAAATQQRALQRFQSNLNPQHLLTHQLDPEGTYILYTRMRLARSLEGFAFSPCISRSDRRAVEQLLKACVKDWSLNKHNKLTGGKYISLLEMTNAQHDDLIQRRILFRDPKDFEISAGLGRDWPDGRGIFCDDWENAHTIIWVNAEDHLWIISNSKGGDVQGVFTKLSQAVWALETSLKHLGYSFVEDKHLGFLNSCPSNIGPALKASVYVKLPRISRQPGFYKLINKLRLEANSSYQQEDKRFTGIFDIANAEALGKSEVELINIMIRGVGILIELEKKLENGEKVDVYAEIDRLGTTSNAK